MGPIARHGQRGCRAGWQGSSTASRRGAIALTWLPMVLVACASKADRWSDFMLPAGTAGAGAYAGDAPTDGSSAAPAVDDDPNGTVDGTPTRTPLTSQPSTSGVPTGGDGSTDASDVFASGSGRSVEATRSGEAGLDTRTTGGVAATRDSGARAAGGAGVAQGGAADASSSDGARAYAGAADMPPGGAAGSVLAAGIDDASAGARPAGAGAGGDTSESALVAGAGAGGNGGRDAPDESDSARGGGAGWTMAGNAGAAGAGATPAARATPVKAVLRYRNEDGIVLDEVTTTRFRFLGTCRPEDSVTLCFDAIGLSLPRHNEMELWLDLGDEWPPNETCWYYDYDGDPVNWRAVSDPLGCDWYLTDWGTKGTRFKETQDLDPYWTVHYHPRTGQSSNFMAWGYADGDKYKYIWFFSASDDT